MRREIALAALTVALLAGCSKAQEVEKTAAPAAAKPAPLYTVINGNYVDENTLGGWHTWRALDCERCHGNQQQGLVGPSLVDGLKTLTKAQFETTVLNGRPGTIMPSFKASKMLQKHIDGLYAFLKGRSDGAIKPGDLHPITPGMTGTEVTAPAAESK